MKSCVWMLGLSRPLHIVGLGGVILEACGSSTVAIRSATVEPIGPRSRSSAESTEGVADLVAGDRGFACGVYS